MDCHSEGGGGAVGEDGEAVGVEGGEGNWGADAGAATDTNGSGINTTAYQQLQISLLATTVFVEVHL